MNETTQSIVGNPELDATVPDISLELGGKTYHLLFKFSSLSIAEKKLHAAGIRISLLVARSVTFWDASNLPYIFFAALQAHHPEITLEQADAMLTFENCGEVLDKLFEAHQAALPARREVASDDPMTAPATAPQ